jgi:hypothetical protein
VHVVAALGESPGPTEEDDRLAVADAENAELRFGHDRRWYRSDE